MSGTTVTRVGFAQDLPAWAPPVAIGLALASLVFLAVELRRSERSRRGLVAALSALEVRIPRWRTMRRFYAAQKNERPGAEAPSRRLPRRGPSPKARRGAPRR